MQVYASLVCLTACCVAGFGQATPYPATPELQLAVTDYGRHFFYSISRPEVIRAAWIETRDRPLLVAKTSVVVQASGTLDWDWDRGAMNSYEQPEDNLVLSIWDPNGESITCSPQGVMSSEPGGVVSGATVGARQQLMRFPRLDSSWVRAAQGSGEITLDVTGQDPSRGTKFHLDTSRGGRCEKQNLHARVLDLAHARITLGADCLQKAGILLVTAEEGSSEGATVHVASRTSPTLDSVSPSSIPDDLRQDKLNLVLRGRGFTQDSVVYAGYNPDAGDYSTDQV